MRIKPLETNRQVFNWLCVYPSDEETSKWIKFVHNMNIILTLIILIAIVSVILIFFIKFVSVELGEALFAVSYSCLLYLLIIIGFLLRCKVTTIFNQLTGIHDECEYQLNR